MFESSKSTIVATTLRREIATGRLKPGQRLPNRVALGTRFDAGMSVVQRALDDLIRDGLVHARPGAGTYVADQLPNRGRIGLVGPDQDSLFYTALRKAAMQVAEEVGVRFQSYALTEVSRQTDQFLQLCDEVREHRLGGLLFLSPPFFFTNSPVLDEPGVPRAAVQEGSESCAASVYVDQASFLDRAIDHLVARGRKHIAHLLGSGAARVVEELERRIQSKSVETRRYWIQRFPPRTPYASAQNIVDLLMRLDGDKRPDALIIHDDNMIEHAIAGLLTAGVNVPEDLEIVAHCNFPTPVPSPLPLRRLGFDCRQIIRECLTLLDAQRDGKVIAPKLVRVPAVFEDELKVHVPRFPPVSAKR